MYANGEVPTSLLVQRPSAGKDPCLMMPGTAVKFDRLTELGAPHSWVPLVSGPSDAYRTVAVQEYYFDTMPAGQAATPRTSSHGGTYDFGDGRGEVEQGAVDIGNWGDIGWDLFSQLARDAGFVPGVFIGRPGIPDEYWHLFDPSPWEVDDMPTIGEIFNTPVTKGPDGNDITLANFLQYAHLWNAQAVWNRQLQHPIAVTPDGKPALIPAGDFLRYEPAEHANTRAVVAKVVTGDIDYDKVAAEIAAKFPTLDPTAFAIAAADEADKRERERLGTDPKA